MSRTILILTAAVLILAAQMMLIGPDPVPSQVAARPGGWDVGFSAALVVAWGLPVYTALRLLIWMFKNKS